MTLPTNITLEDLKEEINDKLTDGADAWDWSGEDFSYLRIKLDRDYITAGEVCQLAVNSKRSLEYETAANSYLLLLASIDNPSISIVTSLFKFLCTINEYVLAFQLISCICADAQVAEYVHPSYKMQLQKMYNTFLFVINKTYDSMDISDLIEFTSGYSGQTFYHPIKHPDFILKEIREIMTQLKKDFGNDTCRYIYF